MKLLPIIAIVGTRQMAEALSQKFARRGTYFAIMEEPGIERPDAGNEISGRTNLLSFIRHEYVILAGCKQKSCELIRARFPKASLDRVIDVHDLGELGNKLSFLVKYDSKEKRSIISIDHGDVKNLSANDQVGVIEKSDSVGEVIAENYCLANNYKVLKIDSASENMVEQCEDLLTAWNSHEDSLLRNEAKNRLFTMLRERVGFLEAKQFKRIIFFTRGIPYGILPFNSLVAHFYQERDLGLQILRAYRRSIEDNAGVALALLCDPGKVGDSESNEIRLAFSSAGVEMVDLQGKKATNFRFMHLIERYPYDLAVIISHAGEIKGTRVTEEYRSTDGIQYTVIYDLYATYAPVPGSDRILLSQIKRLITVNGISWFDRSKIRSDPTTKNFIRKVFFDADQSQRKIIKVEDCISIKFPVAIQLNDFAWFPALHSTGDSRYPIILNNSCSSWLEMASRFIFAETSVYIGTTKDIQTSLAAHSAATFIRLALKRRSALAALYEVQRKFSNSLGYSPYIYWGDPDATLRPAQSDKHRLRVERVNRGLNYWISNRHTYSKERQPAIDHILKCITEAELLDVNERKS